MANHKSEIKRAGQNEIRRLRNKARKTRIKTAGKDVREAVTGGDSEAAATNLNLAKSVIDTAVKKGVIHKNTGARKKSKLSKLVNTLSV